MNTSAESSHLILYDGICGLCNRFVQFVLLRDSQKRFQFVALQDNLARQVMTRHGRNPESLDSMGVLVDWESGNERLLVKSDAALFVLAQLGGIWKLAVPARILPRGFRDWCYDRVANSRYRIFGRLDTCPIPTGEQRARFIDSRGN